MNSIKKVTILLSSLLLTACGSCDWTTEERRKFEDECPMKKSFDGLTVFFRGFDNKAFDSVLVCEYNDSLFVNSFRIKVDTSFSPWDRDKKSRSSSIHQILLTDHIYKFIVDSSNTFVLANMNMVVCARGPFCPECMMGNYTIDGVCFKQRVEPCFVKKNSKK